MVNLVVKGSKRYHEGNVMIIPANLSFKGAVSVYIKDVNQMYEDIRNLNVKLPFEGRFKYKKDKDLIEKIKQDIRNMLKDVVELRKRMFQDRQ